MKRSLALACFSLFALMVIDNHRVVLGPTGLAIVGGGQAMAADIARPAPPPVAALCSVPFSVLSVPSRVSSVPSKTYSRSNRFFVEFRARNATSYGHMYVMYGEVNERREVIRSEIAGFFPAGDSRNCENCSVY